MTPILDLCMFTLIGAGETKGKSTEGKGKCKGEPKGQASTKGKGQPIRTSCPCIFSVLFCVELAVRAQEFCESDVSFHRKVFNI